MKRLHLRLRLHLTTALLLAAAPGLTWAASPQTFDTPTATTAQTLATYGLSDELQLSSATVVDGALRLDAAGAFNGVLGFGSFAGDVVFEFDTRISQDPGAVNVGFAVGSTQVFFHPGYWDHWFINSMQAGALGFTPQADDWLHLRVAVDAETGRVDFTASQGAWSHSASLLVSGYQAGSSVLGFTAGSVSGDAYYGVFDNLTVSSVPEPAAALLLAGGLPGLAAVAGWRRRRGQRHQPGQPRRMA